MEYYGTAWDDGRDHTAVLYRKVAPSRTGGTPVNPDWQQLALDPEGLERGDLLGFGREPGQTRVLDHVVEREQAPHEHLWRGVAAVADVLGSERPVDPPGEDAAHAADPSDAGHGLLGGQTLGNQSVDDAPHLFGVRFTVKTRMQGSQLIGNLPIACSG